MPKTIILKDLAAKLNIAISALEREINASAGVISKSIERNADLSLAIKEKISRKYSNINPEWLETGLGEIFIVEKTVGDNQVVVTSPFRNNKKKVKEGGLIPYYEVDFMAGTGIEFYEDSTITPAYFMDIPEFRGCTAFRAYSDSMEELIKSGNILFGTRLDDWQSHLEYGQIYGITMTDNRRYLKFIRKSNSPNDKFLLKSKNSQYDDFDIPKNKIKNIWLIEGWLNRRT